MTSLTFLSPLLIVRHVPSSVAFYRDRLGFEVNHLAPDDDPFFAMLQRDGVHLMLKAIAADVAPQPNPSHHAWAKWDAYIHTPDPDALAAELTSRGVVFHEPLGVNSDQLRGFEVQDADGYVLFFGRPI